MWVECGQLPKAGVSFSPTHRNGATQLMSGPLNPGTSLSPSSSESRICCTRNHYTTCLRNRLEGEPGTLWKLAKPAPRAWPHLICLFLSSTGETEGTDGVNILKEQTNSTHPPLRFHLHGQLCLTRETTTHTILEPNLHPRMTSSSPSCLFSSSFPVTLFLSFCSFFA